MTFGLMAPQLGEIALYLRDELGPEPGPELAWTHGRRKIAHPGVVNVMRYGRAPSRKREHHYRSRGQLSAERESGPPTACEWICFSAWSCSSLEASGSRGIAAAAVSARRAAGDTSLHQHLFTRRMFQQEVRCAPFVFYVWLSAKRLTPENRNTAVETKEPQQLGKILPLGALLASDTKLVQGVEA